VAVVCYVEAPCEAEAQCAALVKAGKVYAVGTEDMDALTFGSSVLLRHLTFSEARLVSVFVLHKCSVLAFSSSYGLSGGEKGKGNPYSITDRRVPELIPVLGSQPTGDVSHKPGGRLPLLSARPAVTPTSFNRAAW